ncbi:hypothetical protein [Niallia endozanthoxylica]|uniref:Uncharacterized protein n=1 Tax=Niallia endozanthoxylica TaxID=2036016 RepID=A0A5J5GYQ0_9BACI|nr:hypothetical protein [Niallia endozanthoxylica]KAA9013559.1 hypothetical protein F4V44_24750 [Niallia endozanthoxylica]
MNNGYFYPISYNYSSPQWFIRYFCGYPYPHYIIWVPVALGMVPALPSQSSYQAQPIRHKNDDPVESNLPRTGTISITAVGKYEENWAHPLDNGDAAEFKKYLLNKGWAIDIEHYDEHVSQEDFVLAGKTSDIMFHTGHGSDKGEFPLYPKGKILTWKDIGQLTKSKIMFMMTCSVLNVTEWGRLLRNGTHHIFGYTKPSKDREDKFIIREFLAKCFGEGGIAPMKILDAWEYVNTTYDEPWAVVSHRGNIDDYMVGVESGLTQDILGLDDIVRISSEGLETIEIKLEPIDQPIPAPMPAVEAPISGHHHGHHHHAAFELPSLYDVKVQHQRLDVERLAQNLLKGRAILTRNNFFDAHVYTDGQSNLYVYPTEAMIYEGTRARTKFNGTQESAVHTAEEFVKTKGGGMPSNAYVAEVKEQYESGAVETNRNIISYTIVYKNRVESVPVDGNYGDSIKVIVDNNGVSYMFRLWREVTSKEEIIGAPPVHELDARKIAEEFFIKNMKTLSPPKYEDLKQVYWSASFKEFQDKLPVAWKVTLSGKDIFVDAKTGRVLSQIIE